jgi:hypothetical protein
MSVEQRCKACFHFSQKKKGFKGICKKFNFEVNTTSKCNELDTSNFQKEKVRIDKIKKDINFIESVLI